MVFFSKRFSFSIAAAALVAVAVSWGNAEGTPDETLLPAALGVRTDDAGNSWSIESNGTIGRIGSTMVNSGLALQVNGEAFASFQPLMTADGQEFILNGKPIETLLGLQIQRRIRLLEKSGGLQYVELFHNSSPDPLVINVSLVSNFSGNYRSFVSDRGRTEPVILQDPETGIVVLPGSSQSTKAFLFSLASQGKTEKPTISAQNRYGLTFRYQVRIPPGETRSIAYVVSQVIIPQNFDRRSLLSVFGPFSLEAIRESFDPRWSETVVNDGSNGTDNSVLDLGAAVDALGVERGPRDILAVGENSRLIGEVEGSDLSIVSEYGEATFPLSRIAAIRGSNGDGSRSPRIYLKDGQIVTARIKNDDLSFQQTGGETIPIDVKTLDRLVFAESDDEATNLEPGAAVIETYGGDRLRIGEINDNLGFTGQTPWGSLRIPLAQLAKLQSDPSSSLASRIEMDNGIRCMVFLKGDDIKVTLADFEDYSLKPMELKNLITAAAKPEKPEGHSAVGTRMNLKGDQSAVGGIGNSMIPLDADGKILKTSAADIRFIEKIGDSSLSSGGIPVQSPLFRIDRWDGGSITGRINLEELSFHVQGETWKVPVGDIERIETPSPDLTTEALTSIQGLVEKLGSEDWAVREQATKELGAFGYLAVPFLQRELAATSDPEVSRRLQRVLAGMN